MSPPQDVAALLAMVAANPAPGFTAMTSEEARVAVTAMIAMLDAPGAADIIAADHVCQTPSGPVASRSYRSPEAIAMSPGIVFFHGGGWVTGDVESYDGFCRFLAEQSGMHVLSVEYRRAPEHAFPAAFEDALAVARWAATGDGPFDGASTIVLAGDSAGGNLAAATAHALSLEGGAIAAQLLLYPVLDVSTQAPSYRENGDGFLLTRGDMEFFIDAYVPDPTDRTDSRCSPLLAHDLTRMPPTVLLACGLDPLRDEARAYAAALASAGRTILFLEAEGQIHGLATLRRAVPTGAVVLADAIGLLKSIVKRDSRT